MKIKIDEKALLVVSSGLLAGVGTTANFISVPAILASPDPFPCWKVMYNRGKNIAISTILVSTLAGIRLYFKKEDLAYLLVTTLTAGIPAWTVFVMKPINDTLFAMEDKDRVENQKEIRTLVKKWDKMQYVRTALGWGAFLVTVVIVTKSK